MRDQVYKWDFFIAYARPNERQANELYDILAARSRVFLDKRCLSIGCNWDAELLNAQRVSRATAVLISSRTPEAFYQRAEIAEAIHLARKHKHILVPIYLEDVDPWYGLNIVQSIRAYTPNTLAGAAQSLLALLREMKPTAWEYSGSLFSIGDYRVAYLPLINQIGGKIKELSWSQVNVELDHSQYKLPDAFQRTTLMPDSSNHPSCRLQSYEFTEACLLSLTFSRTCYHDYLKTGEHLDDLLPRHHTKTYRDAFGQLIAEGKKNLRPFDLPNICGLGVFVISDDNQLLITKLPETSHVYPGRFSYSASGTLKWGAFPHPFTQAVLKCYEEIKHQVDLEKLRLIGLGADARKLFFQFSFCEKSHNTSTSILSNYKDVRKLDEHHWRARQLLPIPFECEPIIEHLLNGCWEPAAEAALLTLCVKHFGSEIVARSLGLYRAAWSQRLLRDEWDVRACRPGELAVMSPRYPRKRLEKVSNKYVDSVMKFLGNDVRGENVLEVGGGTGRITERLVRIAARVTSIDICEKMISRSRERLGGKATKVRYICRFAQEYRPRPHSYEAVICSLVLIHNVEDSDFHALVEMMCRAAMKVFVFEDASGRKGTSPHTRLRTKAEIIASFERQGFHLEKEARFRLFSDRISFLKLVAP